MTEARVTIDRLAFGGSGVARIDGKVCFVPFGCPGDELIVRVTAEKRSYLTAAITAIVKPGPDRVVPPCPLFASCGGCHWQHIAYPRQLGEKRAIFADALWRGARVAGERIGEVVASPSVYGYRNRVQFKLHAVDGALRIGFFRTGTHFVEDAVEGCPIAAPAINRALSELRGLLASFPEPDRIPQINLDAAEGGVVAVVNYIGDDREGAAAFFAAGHPRLGGVAGLYLQCGRKSTLKRVYGDELLEYFLPAGSGEASRCSLTYRPGGFAQVNGAQNGAILGLVRRFADCGAGDRILDLYCGNGNFSLPLAGSVAAVTGIEEYPDSVASARENCRRNGIGNAGFICCDAGAGLRRLAGEGQCFNTVILDPPRTGAAGALRELIGLGPERIIYVSCDPGTLARDCGILAAGGFRVESSIPVDMFPQTYHLESVTLLRRTAG